MHSDDTISLRHLPRRSSKNCDLQFANNDRCKANYSIDTALLTLARDLSGKTLVGPYVERGSSVVECRTRNQGSPGSNPSLLPFRRLGIFVISIDAPVDSAVYMSTWL